VTPAAEVARRLIARGHGVRFMSEDCNRHEAEASGATFIGWNRAPNRPNRRRDTQPMRDWAAPTLIEGLASVVRDNWCEPSLRYAEDVIEELKRAPADLVVTNEALFGVMAACESLGQKFVVMSPNISLAPLPGLPPLGPGLAPARTPEERAMHAEITNAIQAVFDSGLPALNATRAALGLAPLEHVVDQFKAAEYQMLATAKAFDFPADSLPSHVRYVGPIIADPLWARDWTSPWPDSDDRPLVAVGFSTTFQNHIQVLQNVIDALAKLPVRVLVTRGGSIEAEDLRTSDNCVIVESAPHTILMREAAFVVTHGGHGTVMRAVVGRTPMLVIPHGRDQADNAVRITERGAGLSLTPDASVEAIRGACERLLTEAAFGAAAERLGDLVAAEVEASTIVEDLEATAAMRRAA
jgi:MGT family glycosyltransferase